MSLLERLRQGGTVDSLGQFTLDVEKARSKMARFQLTEPLRFGLEVVMAAVAGGASRIAITAESRQLTFELPDLALPGEALANLDDFMLSSTDQPEERALAHLGVALNSLGQLDPQQITLEVGGYRLHRGAGPDKLEKTEPGSARLQIDGRLDQTSLRQLLEEHCSHCRLELSWNGRRLSASVQTDSLGLELALQSDRSRLELVVLGVTCGIRHLETSIPYRAVAVCDQLKLNASHTDVVENATYQGLVEKAAQSAEEQLLALARQADLAAEPELWKFLLLALAQVRALEEIPLFPTASGTYLSKADLRQLRSQSGSLFFSQRRVDVILEGVTVLLARQPFVLAALQAHFGSSLQDAASRVAEELAIRANQTQWQNSPREAVLPPGAWLARKPVDLKTCRGEVGLSLDAGSDSLVHVLYQSKLLCTHKANDDLSYTAVLDFPRLDLKPDWSGPKDKRFEQALDKLTRAARDLYTELDEASLDADLPAVRHHLLTAMADQASLSKLPAHFLRLRIFSSLQGPCSLEDLQARGCGWVLLEHYTRSLPPDFLPAEIVALVDERERRLLQLLLGKHLSDQRKRLEHLGAVADQLDGEPDLDLPDPGLVEVTVEADGFRGKLGLLPRQLSPNLRLVHRGIALGSRHYKPSGVPLAAVIESADFKPNQDWSDLEDDQTMERALAVVAQAEERAWKELSRLKKPDHERRKLIFKLLSRQPQLKELFWHTPLVETSDDTWLTLAEVQTELEKHGDLLTGTRVTHPERPVLRLSRKLESLLSSLLEGFASQAAGPVVSQLTARQDFLSRSPELWTIPFLGSLAQVSLPAPFQGRLALTSRATGWLKIVYQNRLLEEQKKVFPSPCCVWFSHGKLQPNYNYTAANNLAKLRPALMEAVSKCLAELARSVPRAAALKALLLVASEVSLRSEDRQSLREVPLLTLSDDRLVSLAQLRELFGKSVPVVTPAQARWPREPMLVAPASLWEAIARLAECALVGQVERLRQERRLQAELSSLPSRPSGWLIKRELPGGSVIGIPSRAQEYYLVAQDAQGQTVGHGPRPFLETVAFVVGEFNRLPDSNQVELPNALQEELEEAGRGIYARLAQDYAQGQRSRPVRQLLLGALLELRREVGGKSKAGILGRQLAELPLFFLTGGRRASALALMDEANLNKELVYSPFAANEPDQGLVPVLPEASLEWEIMVGLVGSQNLRRLDEPPRPAGVQRLVDACAWGWSTVSAALERLNTSEQSPRSDRERALLVRLRREFKLSVTGWARRESSDLVLGAVWASWPLGPPAYFGSLTDRGKVVPQLKLNRLNSNLRWLLEHHEQDPNAVLMLCTYLVGLVNAELEQFTNEQELDWLESLTCSLAGSVKPR
ncbi:MAG: hypothetical protein AB7S38_09755 [Vulcanimicrobiota bacterium]